MGRATTRSKAARSGRCSICAAGRRAAGAMGCRDTRRDRRPRRSPPPAADGVLRELGPRVASRSHRGLRFPRRPSPPACSRRWWTRSARNWRARREAGSGRRTTSWRCCPPSRSTRAHDIMREEPTMRCCWPGRGSSLDAADRCRRLTQRSTRAVRGQRQRGDGGCSPTSRRKTEPPRRRGWGGDRAVRAGTVNAHESPAPAARRPADRADRRRSAARRDRARHERVRGMRSWTSCRSTPPSAATWPTSLRPIAGWTPSRAALLAARAPVAKRLEQAIDRPGGAAWSAPGGAARAAGRGRSRHAGRVGGANRTSRPRAGASRLVRGAVAAVRGGSRRAWRPAKPGPRPPAAHCPRR